MQIQISLQEVLQQTKIFQGWLYLANEPFTLESAGVFYDADLSLSPTDEKSVRDGLAQQGLRPTLCAADIEDVIANLEAQLDSKATLDQYLKAFNFFVAHDAFIVLSD